MRPSIRQRLALAYLHNGVIAHPTDTIYGLACLASNPGAISELIKLKRRDAKKGLILLASSIDYVLPYIDPTFVSDLHDGLQMSNNHPTTFLVPVNLSVSKMLRGDSQFIAVRITNNELIRYFCEGANSALVSTSANIQGHKTATSILQLRAQFKGRLAFALSPSTYNNQASTIINLITGERIR